jgi:hypothetical protein
MHPLQFAYARSPACVLSLLVTPSLSIRKVDHARFCPVCHSERIILLRVEKDCVKCDRAEAYSGQAISWKTKVRFCAETRDFLVYSHYIGSRECQLLRQYVAAVIFVWVKPNEARSSSLNSV